MDIKREMRLVTPIVAKDWLQRNSPRNRHIRPLKVDEYSRSMISGHWRDLGDPIIFDVDGNLQNGQHRLLAVIKSQMTITLGVIYNAPLDSYMYIDQGAKRTSGDTLKYKGVKNWNVVAGACQYIYLHEKNGILDRPITRGKQVSSSEIMEVMDKNPGIELSALFIMKRFRSPMIMSPSFLVAVHYITSGFNQDKANEFIEKLIAGTGIEKNTALNKLRDRLELEFSRRQQKTPLRVRQALVIKAWNLFILERKVRNLFWSPIKEEYPLLINKYPEGAHGRLESKGEGI